MNNYIEEYINKFREEFIRLDNKFKLKGASIISICDCIDNDNISLKDTLSKLQLYFNRLAFRNSRKYDGSTRLLQSTVDMVADKMTYYFLLRNKLFKIFEKDTEYISEEHIDKVINYEIKNVKDTKHLIMPMALFLDCRLYFVLTYIDSERNTFIVDIQYIDKLESKNKFTGYQYKLEFNIDALTINKRGFTEVVCDNECDINKLSKFALDDCDSRFEKCINCKYTKGVLQAESVFAAYISICNKIIDREAELFGFEGCTLKLFDMIHSNNYKTHYVKIADLDKIKVDNKEDNTTKIENKPIISKKDKDKINKLLSDFDDDFNI